jgi:uncharacterized radical SAM protein YgiQ
MGCPKLGVLIASGVIDSMVNHYTASKKIRSNDQYSPGGKAGFRPDRAVVVYANKAKEVFKDVPVIIGGIEASLRRFAHYDYWDDRVRRSILLDSKADMLVYGMGEKPILEIAALLKQGLKINEIRNVRGTVLFHILSPDGEIMNCFQVKASFNEAESNYSVLPLRRGFADTREYAKGIRYNIRKDAVREILFKSLG